MTTAFSISLGLVTFSLLKYYLVFFHGLFFLKQIYHFHYCLLNGNTFFHLCFSPTYDIISNSH